MMTTTIEYDGIVATTKGAVLFALEGYEVWIPRSCIEDPPQGDGLEKDGPPGEVEIATWLAEKEGLA